MVLQISPATDTPRATPTYSDGCVFSLWHAGDFPGLLCGVQLAGNLNDWRIAFIWTSSKGRCNNTVLVNENIDSTDQNCDTVD